MAAAGGGRPRYERLEVSAPTAGIQGEMFQPVGVRRGAAAMDEAFARMVIEVPTAETRGLVRGTDPLSSQAAALTVKPKISALQRRILEIIAMEGPRSAKALERRTEFGRYAPSTVRCRVSALANPKHFDPPLLIQAADPVSGAPLWDEGCAVMEIPRRAE